MTKNKLYICILALICALTFVSLVGCAIGDKPVGSGNEETSDVVETLTEVVGGSDGDGNSQNESAGEEQSETETEEESETKNYGMGFVPV